MNKDRSILIHFIFIAALSNLIFIGISLPLIPDDYWWHVSIGKWIVKNYSLNIPKTYSWLSQYYDLIWIDHSWLCEIILYAFSKIGDVGALIYIILFNTLGYFLFIYRLVNKTNKFAFTIFTIFYFIIFQFLLAPRPYIMGFFFLLTLIHNLENIKNNNKWNFPILIITLILWANSHGGSIILSILFVLYYLLFSILNINTKFITIKKQEKSKIKKYLMLFFTTIICSLINPYGIKSVLYILKGGVTTSYIPEWKSIFEFNQAFYYMLIILILVLLFVLIKKNDLQNTVVIFGLCFLTCIHMRYIEYLIILIPFYLVPKLNFCIAFFDKKFKHLGYIIFSLFGIISIMLLLDNPDIFKKPIPDEILTEVKESDRIFNDYDFGGYLIYNNIPVFWDSRADLYVDSGILAKSFMFQEYDLDDLEMVEFIKEYNFEYIVIKQERGLNKYLLESDEYINIKTIDKCVLYKKNRSCERFFLFIFLIFPFIPCIIS